MCICCALNYLVMLLNYTEFYVFLFGNLVFFCFYFVFGGKFTISISTFVTPSIQILRIFPQKWFLLAARFQWGPCSIIPRSSYFLMNIERTRLQQSIIFNLFSIATYNKHLFTIILIILIIHIFGIFHYATDIYFFYIHLFCFSIKIVKQCLFFSFTPIFYWNIFTYWRLY